MGAPVSFCTFFDQTILPESASKQNASPHRLNTNTRVPSTVGLPVVPPSKYLSPRSAGYECFQVTFPVAASKHHTVSRPSVWPRVNARPCEMTKDEKPRPTLAFHAIGGPSFGQVSRHAVSVETPLRCGPR